MELRQQLIKDIELLPENILRDISAIIKERIALNDKRSDDIGEKRREAFGCLKGKIHVPDDFNEPLDDFKEYME